jgi:hypothetical protein
MARMRTVKPGFFTSEEVAALPLRARLLWIGLWTHCDDHGRTKELVKLIKAAVWPLDDVSLRDVQDDLTLLEQGGQIVRYESGVTSYIAVQNWHFHQKPNRPTESKVPAPPVPIAVPRPNESGHCPQCWADTHGALSDSVSAHERLTPGGERRGEGGEGAHAPTPAPGRPRCPRHASLPSEDPGPNCVGCRDARLATERTARPPLASVPEWCGQCAGPNRRQVEREDGSLARCPRCHPMRSAG